MDDKRIPQALERVASGKRLPGDPEACFHIPVCSGIPEVFKAAGYYTASYGKVGHGWGLRKVWGDYVPHKRDPNPPLAPFLPFARGEQDWPPPHLAEEDMNDSKYADAAIRQLGKKHDRPFLIA